MNAHARPSRWSPQQDADLPPFEKRAYDEFDFGYALTTHKSQGSQWDSVLVINESSAFREDKSRWLYTAITRAAERVIVTI